MAFEPRQARERSPEEERAAEQYEAAGGAETAERLASQMGNQSFGGMLDAVGAAAFALPGAALEWVTDQASGRPAASSPAGPTTAGPLEKLAFINRVVAAANQAMRSWSASAVIVGVVVQGPTGVGGALVGPPLGSLIPPPSGTSPAETALEARALQAFATAFEGWRTSFVVPGLVLWPAFAAFPAPVAPPTPSIPMPLLAMAPGPFVLPLGGDEALVEAIAPLTSAFEIWRGSKIVSNLMGTGPVPSFAPPYVPVGPVVGGVANGIPGSIQ